MKTVLLLLVSIALTVKAFSQKQPVKLTKPATVSKSAAKVSTLEIKGVQTTMDQIETKLKELETLIDKLKKEKDSMTDLGTQNELELQKVMNKKSQLENMLSSLMKSFSETSSGIIQNMK